MFNFSAGSSTQRPIGFVPPGSAGHGNQPIGPPKTVGTQGNAPPPYQGILISLSIIPVNMPGLNGPKIHFS